LVAKRIISVTLDSIQKNKSKHFLAEMRTQASFLLMELLHFWDLTNKAIVLVLRNAGVRP
jgi:hypothetical protein